MAESTADSNVKESPLSLAAAVSSKVQIEAVLLSESQVRRAPKADLTEDGLKTQCDIVSVSYGKKVDENRIFILPTFRIKISKDLGGDSEDLLNVEATFVLIYSLNSFEGLDDDKIEAFGATNGVYNAWPYWREYVQNTVVRMGFGAITVPVFRI